MKRYIVISQSHPPFSTDYFDPAFFDTDDGAEQTIVDLATMKYQRNYGDKAGEWIDMEEDCL